MIGYIRVSDINKADGESQREAIKAYAKRNNIKIKDWIEEHVSGSKTDIKDRRLHSIIQSGQSIIVSDITRLGRNKVMQLIGLIGSIAERGELHLAYNNKVINSKNVDDTETIFTVVGESFASAQEAKRRSERAKAGHAKRKAGGLKVGREYGQAVKSKLDDHLAFVLVELEKGTSKVKILTLLKDKKCKVSRARFYTWLKDRKLMQSSHDGDQANMQF